VPRAVRVNGRPTQLRNGRVVVGSGLATIEFVY